MSEIVKVEVGHLKVPFKVHKQVLCSSSDYFKAALKQCWHESDGIPLTLPEHDAEVFHLYINWLYSRKIETTQGDNPTQFAQYELLSKAAVFGEVLQDIEFKDHVMDTFVVLANMSNPLGIRWIPPAKSVSRIFDNLPKDSGGRRLMVDLYVCAANEESLKGTDKEDYCWEFLLELSRALLSMRLIPGILSVNHLVQHDLCIYHDHKKYLKPCYRAHP